MTHKAVKEQCDKLGLRMEIVADPTADAYAALKPGVRVFWRKKKDDDQLVGRPIVTVDGKHRPAKDLAEIAYMVKDAR